MKQQTIHTILDQLFNQGYIGIEHGNINEDYFFEFEVEENLLARITVYQSKQLNLKLIKLKGSSRKVVQDEVLLNDYLHILEPLKKIL